MSRRPSSPAPKAPDWPPARTLGALRKQLSALEGLRNRNFREAHSDEQEWMNLTRSVLIRGFGEHSENVLQFFRAENAGAHYAYEVRDDVHQSNFELRIKAYAPVIKSSISELEMMLPDSGTLPEERPSLKKQAGDRIFIGHGRSKIWRELKDFLDERLHLKWDEFDRESAAGFSTKERLETMLDNARFAFLVMTAEDEYPDESLHPRENVIHEAGLFQGRLGFKCAIILMEEGCAEFSNLYGLTQIRFPKGNITAAFEEIRRVLEREGITQQ